MPTFTLLPQEGAEEHEVFTRLLAKGRELSQVGASKVDDFDERSPLAEELPAEYATQNCLEIFACSFCMFRRHSARGASKHGLRATVRGMAQVRRQWVGKGDGLQVGHSWTQEFLLITPRERCKTNHCSKNILPLLCSTVRTH